MSSACEEKMRKETAFNEAEQKDVQKCKGQCNGPELRWR